MSDRKSLFQLRTLPPAVLALAAVALSGTAQAQSNAANGATLYKQPVPIPMGAPASCENCHGPAFIFKAASTAGAISAAISANRGGMNAFSSWTAAQIGDVATYVAAAAPPTLPPLALPPGTPAPAPTPTPAPPPPGTPTTTPTINPSPAMFSSTEVGRYSATTGILVTNGTTVAVSLATPALVPPSGTSTEFVVTTAPAGTTNCVPGFRLDPGTSCSFGVQFAPLAAGVRSEKWTINFADGVAAREVTLEGTAIAGTGAGGGTAPTGSSAANSPADGGGAALGLTHLLGLLALSGVGGLRRRFDA